MELLGQCVLDGTDEKPRGELIGLALLTRANPPCGCRVMAGDEVPELVRERTPSVHRAEAAAQADMPAAVVAAFLAPGVLGERDAEGFG